MVAASLAGTFPFLARLPKSEVLLAITDLAVFFIMLLAGVEMKPKEIVETSMDSLTVALFGMLCPFILGFGLGWWFLPESGLKLAQAVFVGTALAITAVPASVRVLMDLHLLHSRVGKFIVSAAIIDDILGLLLLALLTAIIQTGEFPKGSQFGLVFIKVSVFFCISLLVARFGSPFMERLVKKLRAENAEFNALILVGLVCGLLADWMGLHFIVGAFMAGLFFRRSTLGSETFRQIKSKLNGVTSGIFGPIFLASIGLRLELGAITAIPGFLILLIIAAFVSKLVGAGIPAHWAGLSKMESLAVGIGMSSRGAVELVVADIALRMGVFSMPPPVSPVVSYLFSAVVIMAVVTTFVVPILLRSILPTVKIRSHR